MVSTDIGVIPLDPPTEILICPHCFSSTDPSTLLLEVGRQVVLGHHLMLNYWLSRHFLCGAWITKVRHASQSVQVFTANTHLLGTFTVLPKLGKRLQEWSWITSSFFDMSTDYNDSFGPTHSTPKMPMAPLLLLQWLFTLLLEVGRQVVLGQYLALTCWWSRLSLVVCGCAVSSTQLFLWVNWLWKYTFVRSALS